VRGMKFLALLFCLIQHVACSPSPDAGAPRAPEPAAYLFAWAGDQDEREGDSNFLAVIDVDPASATYRQIVATAPIGTVGGMPHHSEAEMPPDGHPLFAKPTAMGYCLGFLTRRRYQDGIQCQRAGEDRTHSHGQLFLSA